MQEPAALAGLARYASMPLPRKPLLVPWVQPIDVGDGLLELRAEQTFYPLRHPLFAAAFRAIEDRLTGAREVESIVAELPAGIEPAGVIVLLKMLRALGLLLDASELGCDDGGQRERLLFLSHFTVQPALVEKRLAAATVRVVGPGLLAERLLHHLEAAGCGQVARVEVSDLERGGAVDLLIACADAPARNSLARVNAAALEKAQPWLRAAAHGPVAWLGPLVIPGETACFECLRTREQANARGQGRAPDFEPGAIGAFAPQAELLAAQAAAEATRFLGGLPAPATIGQVYELSATSPRAEGHVLLRDPRCLACGSLWSEEP